ncbi:unnamed protein product [Cuscuta europaea]|uniref:Uncharacterized protein n=1 Tax=Cuscuta europaea TaxID=41803 RepID=A0A9P1EIK6_CUSEU|nr:unnamed protein product [Cuscuta europaea]
MHQKRQQLENKKRRGSVSAKRTNVLKRRYVSVIFGTIFGFLIGVTFPPLSLIKPFVKDSLNAGSIADRTDLITNQNVQYSTKIWASSNPRGAERLPPKLVVSESDLFRRRLCGEPSEDLVTRPKYLAAISVGYKQKNNVDDIVKKFSKNFTILLFHYDDHTTEWDEFEWSKLAIHVTVTKQTKWWYAKRFLHPDIVSPYEYIFIWDEDLGIEKFDAEEYIKLVKKHGLEISQPAMEGSSSTWKMSWRLNDREVHKKVMEEKSGFCNDSHLPPCAAFVEIMAPVFSREAWRCVWHMLQNDLVHGWGLDFTFRRCVAPAHEKIGVVDAQPVLHRRFPSITNEGMPENGMPGWLMIRTRSIVEWKMFEKRVANAEEAYYKSNGIDLYNFTALKKETTIIDDLEKEAKSIMNKYIKEGS